ncbi:MAG: hypothetical protein EON58_21900 [Alphaproteobacteria bacterium]|nr:MAG: hypothetical protein EON58_21900 [Alphaproteobacteria bacterium]
MSIKKMLTTLAASLIMLGSANARAEDWREKIPEVRISVRAVENAEGMAKWSEFVAYLQNELRQKVVLRQSTDYAGTVEALRAKRLEVAILGGAAYVQAWIATKGDKERLR